MELDEELERCRGWIEAALEYSGGTHDFEDVVNQVKQGMLQFWPAPDACAITEILTYPKKKVMHIFLAGGNMDTIVAMNESAERFAKFNGCTGMSIAGRTGWSRVLKAKGYQVAFTTLGKDI